MRCIFEITMHCIVCSRFIKGQMVAREKYKDHFVGCKKCGVGGEIPFAVSSYISLGDVSNPKFQVLVQLRS